MFFVDVFFFFLSIVASFVSLLVTYLPRFLDRSKNKGDQKVIREPLLDIVLAPFIPLLV